MAHRVRPNWVANESDSVFIREMCPGMDPSEMLKKLKTDPRWNLEFWLIPDGTIYLRKTPNPHVLRVVNLFIKAYIAGWKENQEALLNA